MDTAFGFGHSVDLGFAEAIERVTDELSKEGFGVLSDIDVAATLHKKLGITLRPYRILGACNPALASQAISEVPDIGLLLPCNVVVREDDEGRVMVSFLDPERMLSLAETPALVPVAADVKARLQRVADRL